VLRTKLGNAPYHSYTLYNEYKAEPIRSLYQWWGVDGVTCFPSHLIFFRRHSSHALVTLRLFCMGIELLFDCSPVGASSAGVPDFESTPCWSPACHCESSSGSSFGDVSGLCIEVLPLSTIRDLDGLANLWLSKLRASGFALRLQKQLAREM
jgi:hypothetical protein